MINLKIGAVIAAAAFIAGAFVASPELRAYAANTIGSSDIIDESIQSADIKNGQVKASDIATDAVGAAEIQGVTKLLFGKCVTTSGENSGDVGPGVGILIDCSISGVDSNDMAVATVTDANSCFAVTNTDPQAGKVVVTIRNTCPSAFSLGSEAKISVVVYDK